jgi:radical SAM protein with 4Fe4S-binding SPASM domain
MVVLSPDTVVWEYTLRCNSKCLHCGSNAKNPRKNELTTAESLKLVEDIKDIGFNLIVLSGGEPTLRKDWVEISEKINSERINLGIISNALEWDQSTIDAMHSLNPYAAGFSVDGEEELHDYLRGIQGSHRKVFDTIKKLKRKGVTVCAITSVNGRNLEELSLIRNRLIVYGVDAWQIQTASPMGRMAKRKDLVLTKQGYQQLGQFLSDTREKLKGYMNVQGGDCIGYFGRLEKRIRDYEWVGCMAGIKGLGIDSDGGVRGCLSIRDDSAIEGNVRNTPLKNIWQNPTNFKYTRSFDLSDLKGQCVGCDYGEKCKGGCQSQSFSFYKKFNQAPYCLSKNEQK